MFYSKVHRGCLIELCGKFKELNLDVKHKIKDMELTSPDFWSFYSGATQLLSPKQGREREREGSIGQCRHLAYKRGNSLGLLCLVPLGSAESGLN